MNLTERENLECILSDCYKEVWGIRPRFLNMTEMSISELQDMIDRLAEESMQMEEESYDHFFEDVVEVSAPTTNPEDRWIDFEILFDRGLRNCMTSVGI